jgi:hypothetical protein
MLLHCRNGVSDALGEDVLWRAFAMPQRTQDGIGTSDGACDRSRIGGIPSYDGDASAQVAQRVWLTYQDRDGVTGSECLNEQWATNAAGSAKKREFHRCLLL